MKLTIAFVSAWVVTSVATAQPTPSQPSAETKTTTAKTTALQEPKPAGTNIHKYTWSGSVVTTVKKGNPLQLINPFAPTNYGTGQVTVDPVSQRPTGWKLFSFNW